MKNKKVVIFGAGGAATSIQVQLALEGVKEIHIFNPKDKFFERAEQLKETISKTCPGCTVTVNDVADQTLLGEKIANCDICLLYTSSFLPLWIKQLLMWLRRQLQMWRGKMVLPEFNKKLLLHK